MLSVGRKEMKEHIDSIRASLAKLESESQAKEPDSFERNYDALELPQMVSQIVDHLTCPPETGGA